MLTKGPTYREANDVDWTKAYHCIQKGVCELQQEWCAKENVAVQTLDEWKYRLLHEVKIQIKALKKQPSVRYRTKPEKVLDDKEVKTYLDKLHEKFVITPTDKAGNNFSIVCKKFYILSLLKELGISSDSDKKKQSQTYKKLKVSDLDIVKRHVNYMSRHDIKVTDDQKSLPFLYWIPKMHKNPSKQRYIAASHSCSTKPLSKLITLCLKLIQQTHSNHCKTIAKNRGYERMWIVDNSIKVLEKLREFNGMNLAKSIRTYDFSTLYTSIPHKDLKNEIAWVISECFNDDTRRFIHIDECRREARWSKTRGKGNGHVWNKQDLIGHVNWLIDNIYVVCGDSVFKQAIGIPMGTDCALFLANLFLFAFEYKWLLKKFEEKDFDTLNKFKHCFRYIDDLMCLNNDGRMEDVMTEIYPNELALTSDDAVLQSNYLDLDIEIRDDKFHTKLFDKRDAFSFQIVNFPDLSGNIPHKHSYGVFVSQLIRYARCCDELADFTTRSQTLIEKLTKQNFVLSQLRRVFEKFAATHYELLFKYNVSPSTICDSCC